MFQTGEIQRERELARKFDGDRLVIASHNKGKLSEISLLLKDYVARFSSAAELGLPEPDETGKTFIENAVIKAQEIAKSSGEVALADDSGLCVTALNDEPGIYSARWAVQPDGHRDFAKAMQRVEDALGDNPDRSARFVSAMALAWPDGHVETVQSEIAGQLTWPARGDQGFGFDPVFIPEGYVQTFGEMKPADKHKISHRTLAFEQIIEKCFR